MLAVTHFLGNKGLVPWGEPFPHFGSDLVRATVFNPHPSPIRSCRRSSARRLLGPTGHRYRRLGLLNILSLENGDLSVHCYFYKTGRSRLPAAFALVSNIELRAEELATMNGTAHVPGGDVKQVNGVNELTIE